MLAVFTIIILLLILAIGIFFNMSMWRHGINTLGIGSGGEKSPWARYSHLIDAGMSWFFSKELEEREIVSYDGLKLKACYLPAEGANTTIILMHGYRSKDLFDFSCIYRMYYELGYNLLVPYQRAHGKSQGQLIYFGVKERYDCASWCEYVSQTAPEQDIVIEGMSMGATTVLMAAGLKLPQQVRGVIADCGFNTPYDVMESTMRRWGIPARPYLDLMALVTKLIGFDMRTSTEDSLKNCRLPVLLIHGTKDKIVPYEMSVRNKNACAGECTLVTVEGAGHGTSYMLEPDRCVDALQSFLKKYCKAKDE